MGGPRKVEVKAVKMFGEGDLDILIFKGEWLRGKER